MTYKTLEEFAKANPLLITPIQKRTDSDYKWSENHRHYKVSSLLGIPIAQFSCPKKDDEESLAASVWSCLAMDSQGIENADQIQYDGLESAIYSEEFADFCDNFGYERDSISALKTYWDCVKIAAILQSNFNEQELENLYELASEY